MHAFFMSNEVKMKKRNKELGDLPKENNQENVDVGKHM
jgi:hypothetical protein